MGFKDEFKREMKNVIKDVEKEVHKTWKIEYKGHQIEIINQIKEEVLIIDGVTADRNKRKYLLSHIIPYTRLSGAFMDEDGTKHTVSVKIGGYIRFNCVVKIDNETVLDESTKLEFLPWEHKEKIVPFIQKQVQSHQQIVDEHLPDEEYLYGEDEPRMAPGLFDHLADDIPVPFHAKKLVKCFSEQVHHPGAKTRKSTYDCIIFDNIAGCRDELIERLQQAELDEALVEQEALWLLEHAAHRDVVKFALLALGTVNCETHIELIHTLGLHEEFTFYAVFALKNGTRQSNGRIWRLAQSVHGWGRIAAVEQLEAQTPDIKYWLLSEGCRNIVMNDYLAYTCAVNGELDVALHEETISKELYDGAGVIIQGLLGEAAYPGIEEYPYAGQVLARFIYHSRRHCQSIDDFYPLIKISEFLEEPEEPRFTGFHTVRDELQTFIKDPVWPKLAIEALEKENHAKAREIARFYQLDITARLFDWLEQCPADSELYSAIMDTDDRKHIERLCAFAETHLSLSSLSGDEQECLQYIVQDLEEYEGVGRPLIQSALTSDDGSLQYHALRVLNEWPPSYSQEPAIQERVRQIANETKDKEDRQLAKALLKK